MLLLALGEASKVHFGRYDLPVVVDGDYVSLRLKGRIELAYKEGL